MADARLKGSLGVRQVSYVRDRDRTNGDTVTIKYRGLLPLIQAAQDNDFYTEGAARSTVTQNGDSEQDAILTVVFSAASQDDAINEQPAVNEFSNTWTFAPQREQIDVWTLPKYRDLADIESGYLERIQQAVDEYKRQVASGITNQDANKDLVFTLSNFITLKGTAEQIVTASELSSLLLAGKVTAERDRAALRNVRVVPGNSSLTADQSWVNYMWTNERLIGLVNSSGSAITQRALIGDLSNSFDGSYWFKTRPEINEMTNNRFEIITEWINYESQEFETTVNSIFS